MPTGLIIRDDSGNVIIDSTMPVGKILGSFSTGGNLSGTFTDSRIIGQRVFYFSSYTYGLFGGVILDANTSNGVISWKFEMQVNGVPMPNTETDTVFYGIA